MGLVIYLIVLKEKGKRKRKSKVIPFLVNFFHNHSWLCHWKCILNKMHLRFFCISIYFLLSIRGNLLHAIHILLKSLSLLYGQVLDVPWYLWYLIMHIVLKCQAFDARNCSSSNSWRGLTLTIAAFLDVNVANISAIFSKACFSSLAAPSCLAKVKVYNLMSSQYHHVYKKIAYFKHPLKINQLVDSFDLTFLKSSQDLWCMTIEVIEEICCCLWNYLGWNQTSF